MRERLKEFRQSVGLSQEQIARALGVSTSLYLKVERGLVPPSRAFMQKIKAMCPEISIDEMFFSE